jgi:hypothetical protein
MQDQKELSSMSLLEVTNLFASLREKVEYKKTATPEEVAQYPVVTAELMARTDAIYAQGNIYPVPPLEAGGFERL